MSLLGDITKGLFGVGSAAYDIIQAIAKGAGGAEKLGNSIAEIAKRAKIDDLVKFGKKLASVGGKVADSALVRAANSPILKGGQFVITGMRLTTGVGNPERGGQFNEGAARLGGVDDTLSSAYPTGSWEGAGSDAYRSQNGVQQGRAHSLAGTDVVLVEILNQEADQITTTRDNLDLQSDWLSLVGLTTMTMALIPGWGQAAKTATELAAVATAVGVSAAELKTMSANAGANAAAIQQAAARYADVAATAQPGAVTDFSAPPASPGCAVPGSGPSGPGGNGGPNHGPGAQPCGGGGGSAPSTPALSPNPVAGEVGAGVPPVAAEAGSGPAGGLPGLGGPLPGAGVGQTGGMGMGLGALIGELVKMAAQTARSHGKTGHERTNDAKDDATGDAKDDAKDDAKGEAENDARSPEEEQSAEGDQTPDGARAGFGAAERVPNEAESANEKTSKPGPATMERTPQVVPPAAPFHRNDGADAEPREAELRGGIHVG